MNVHYTTKSLFVGATIVGTGMLSGRADITFDEGFRTNVRAIVSKALTERCTTLNALYPGTISDVQLGEDVDTVCGSLFDRDTGFAHYFTDDFYKTHNTFFALMRHPEATLRLWLERNVFHEASSVYNLLTSLPDDVEFQGSTNLHIGTAVVSLVERIKQKQMSEAEITALRETNFIRKCYSFRDVGKSDCVKNGGYCRVRKSDYYARCYYKVCENMSREIATVWYPYVLARLSRGKKAHWEIAQKIPFPFSNELCQAFFISLLKNYSRYLTIKEDLDNKRFTADTYQMYAKFKEVNESLKRMALLERCSSAKGTQGTGILSFVGYISVRKFDEAKQWARMAEKLEETAKLCKEVEGHREVKRMSRRHREFMRILADSDNR